VLVALSWLCGWTLIAAGLVDQVDAMGWIIEPDQDECSLLVGRSINVVGPDNDEEETHFERSFYQ